MHESRVISGCIPKQHCRQMTKNQLDANQHLVEKLRLLLDFYNKQASDNKIHQSSLLARFQCLNVKFLCVSCNILFLIY